MNRTYLGAYVVGTNVHFKLGGTPTPGLRFVWRWWDGSVDVTTVPETHKVINRGGNPSDGGSMGNSQLLVYNVDVVADDGTSQTYSGSITADNPPQVIPGITVTKNNSVFPYDTSITISAYDYLGQGLVFTWYDDLGNVLQTDTGNSSFEYMAIWNGQVVNYNDSAFPRSEYAIGIGYTFGPGGVYYNGMVTAHSSTLNYTATRDTTIRLVISKQPLDFTTPTFDSMTFASGSTTTVSFDLVGSAPKLTTDRNTITISSLLGDASSPVTAIIGESSSVAMSVYSNNTDAVSIMWSFLAVNGWSTDVLIPAATADGTLKMLVNGTWMSSILKDISGETPGLKQIVARITDLVTSEVSTVTIPITLSASGYPTITGLNVSPTTLPEGQLIQYTVDASQPDGNVLNYRWDFSVPLVTLYGRTVYVDTTNLGGQFIAGQVTVYDSVYGKGVSGTLEQVAVVNVAHGTNTTA